MMVTGDHPVTAGAIAKQLGIDTSEAVITGREIDKFSDDELYEHVGRVSIFARVSPLNKLRIVQQLIRRGEVVAVTGDGVNDAPALKAAHIGVAMGKTGTDVAKETADIVVTDDNFASTNHVLFQMFHVFNARSEDESVFRIPVLSNPLTIPQRNRLLSCPPLRHLHPHHAKNFSHNATHPHALAGDSGGSIIHHHW